MTRQSVQQLRTPTTSNSEFECEPPCVAVSVRTKILAYLGQCKKDEWVNSKKVIADLQLRAPTAKNTVTTLENAGLVERRGYQERGQKMDIQWRLDSRFSNAIGEPFIPPDWSDAYGKHPRTL